MKHRLSSPPRCSLARVALGGRRPGWASANRFGGSTATAAGATSHENRYGGSIDARGGRGHGAHQRLGRQHGGPYGGGTEHTNAYGGTTRAPTAKAPCTPALRGDRLSSAGRALPSLPGLPPAGSRAVYSTGCYGCAAAAGAVVGVAAGAAVASANTAAAPRTRTRRVSPPAAQTAAPAPPTAPGWRRGAAAACDGRQLRGAARRRDGDPQERRDLLPERQHLVPAGLRRERGLLPGRAAP